MIDRTTKIILAFIAAGLWLNLVPTFIGPINAAAQDYELRQITSYVANIANGICVNRKIC